MDLLQRERCGALFQRTTLLDALTVAGNVRAALTHADRRRPNVKAEAEAKTKKRQREDSQDTVSESL